ncbi:MAG: hypothetical protein KF868_03825 [Acidobacteria bacterium]|nr:hypothetical protein [Acidobacteriota bacterium]MCW5971092.1 hypothetical protein [Blastocatellales bacterium]
MIEIAVVAEAEADLRIASKLADRMLFLEDPCSWLHGQHPEDFRSWCGLKPGTTFTRWPEIRSLSKSFPRLMYLRRNQPEPRLPDYAPARKAILLSTLLRPKSPPSALLLIRDLDNQEERRAGLKQAISEIPTLVVLIATPNPQREAWVLNGFLCGNESESGELRQITRDLGFDPCIQAERLRHSSRTDSPERDPKRIVERLTEGKFEREELCWTQTSITMLRDRGEKTHLADYLDEVRRLLPLLGQ